MKKIYRKFIKSIEHIPALIEAKKNYMFEILAIYKKRNLYKNIKWTKEQKKQFDDYWKNVYGKKISDKWHKLYQSINGTFNVEYFPDILYTAKLENKLNSYEYMKVFSDKNMLQLFLNDKIENVRCPFTYVSSTRGLYYSNDRKLLSFSQVEELLKNIGEVVIKPTVDSSSGRGVRILEYVDGVDVRTGETIYDVLKRYKTDFVIQEKILPHPVLRNLYSKSINTFRVITYICKNEICVAPLALRIGSGGGFLDNIHAGGMVVGVSYDGLCCDKAYALGNCDSKLIYTVHPDTGIAFKDYEIPMIGEIIEVAKKLHSLTQNLGVVSWDLTVNDNDEIIVVEANTRGQSVWFPQIINKSGLFGENTKEIIGYAAKVKVG